MNKNYINNINIQMSYPDIDQTDIEGVIEVLKSGRLALGPKTEEFERMVAEYCNVKHAVAVSSGTSALHLIVKSKNINEGDEVIVPSYTFAASVNSFLYERAKPKFIDIEDDTYNLDPNLVESNITKKTKAIMAVDIFGHPVEWDALLEVADRHGLVVIDDSCESLGAEYKGKKIGSFGDAASFAFYPNKQMTTGEGGIIVTNDDTIAKTCRSLRNQGRGEMNSWLDHDILGYNYRLDELSAALGVSQFKRLESFLDKRKKVAEYYTQRLTQYDWLSTPVVRPYVKMSWFIYVITLAKGLDRDVIIKELEKEGIPARGYFSPIHTQKYIRDMFGDFRGTLPVTESIAKRTLALPFHNHLKDNEIDTIIDVLSSAAKKYC